MLGGGVEEWDFGVLCFAASCWKGPQYHAKGKLSRGFLLVYTWSDFEVTFKYLYFCFFVQTCAYQLFVNLFLRKILLCTLSIFHFPWFTQLRIWVYRNALLFRRTYILASAYVTKVCCFLR